MEKHTKERRDFLRKGSNVDVTYSGQEGFYKNPEYNGQQNFKEPHQFVSWEEFLDVTGRGPDYIMRS